MNRIDARLCGIVDGSVLRLEEPAVLARDLIEAGCTALIYRPGPFMRMAAADAAALVEAAAGIPLLILDRVDLARSVGAAGVVLRQTDLDPRAARGLLDAGAIVAVEIAEVGEADELFRLPVDCAIVHAGSDAAGLDIIGRLAFRAHLAAPGIAVVASLGADPGSDSKVIGAGADGLARPAPVILSRSAGGRAIRTAIDIALSGRGGA